MLKSVIQCSSNKKCANLQTYVRYALQCRNWKEVFILAGGRERKRGNREREGGKDKKREGETNWVGENVCV